MVPVVEDRGKDLGVFAGDADEEGVGVDVCFKVWVLRLRGGGLYCLLFSLRGFC